MATQLLYRETEVLYDVRKEVGLEVNTEKTKHLLMSSPESNNIKVADRYFENVAKFTYFESINQFIHFHKSLQTTRNKCS
jgi:hypothetical protein